MRLARWEDRGFYAQQQATEQAQRQLLKLVVRAEAALGQPCAPVLAAAMAATLQHGSGSAAQPADKAPAAAATAAAAAPQQLGPAAEQRTSLPDKPALPVLRPSQVGLCGGCAVFIERLLRAWHMGRLLATTHLAA